MNDSAAFPDPPYPPDVRARGWRFELDMERINSSDTWAVAGQERRPWLLMVWATSWNETPAGSLPDNDVVISAKIGMPLEAFRANRDMLLRGWYRCNDGRLYHRIISERVVAMLGRRADDAQRVARWRAANKPTTKDVTRNTSVNDALAARDSRVNTTPEPEPEPEEQEPEGKSRPPTASPSLALASPASPAKPKREPRRARATPLPEAFGISPTVRAWAAKSGFADRLDDYLEAFVGKAEAHGYLYVDWDAAFRNSIIEDWGGVRSRPPRPRPGQPKRLAL